MVTLYRVELTDAQRADLRTRIGTGVAPARQLTRARILLKADHAEAGPGWTDGAIAGALEVNRTTVSHVRRQFVQDGLAAALARKRPDRTYPQLIDGDAEAKVIAVACSTPPDGQARWSLRLLADELVRLEVVDAISHETVRQTLKKTRSSRGWSRNGAWPRPPIPPSLATWRMSLTSTTVRMIRPTGDLPR